jgi:hypothetical protein
MPDICSGPRPSRQVRHTSTTQKDSGRIQPRRSKLREMTSEASMCMKTNKTPTQCHPHYRTFTSSCATKSPARTAAGGWLPLRTTPRGVCRLGKNSANPVILRPALWDEGSAFRGSKPMQILPRLLAPQNDRSHAFFRRLPGREGWREGAPSTFRLFDPSTFFHRGKPSWRRGRARMARLVP